MQTFRYSGKCKKLYFQVIYNTMVVFGSVIYVAIKHHQRHKDVKQKKKVQSAMKTLIGIILIMFTFGIQWFFGALTIKKASSTFQWLFVIFSTLQGFMLFLNFVILKPKVRKVVKNGVNRKIGNFRQLLQPYFLTPKTKSTSDTLTSTNVHCSKGDETLSMTTGTSHYGESEKSSPQILKQKSITLHLDHLANDSGATFELSSEDCKHSPDNGRGDQTTSQVVFLDTNTSSNNDKEMTQL